MLFYTSPIPCIVLGVIIVLHLLSALFSDRVAPILTSVNVCLHGVLAVAELSLGATLAEMTLLYAVSFLLYLVFASCFAKRRGVKDERGDGNDL